MAHPSRGSITGRHGYRSIPRRVKVRILNHQSEELYIVTDAFWSDVDYRDNAIVVNVSNETRTWKLPQLQTPTRPFNGYMIREVESLVLWEILSVRRPSDNEYHCVTVLMNEHNAVIP